MKLSNRAKRPSTVGRLAAALLMLSLWLGVSAVEVSPELHQFLHKDANAPGHNCLVTQLQHHLVLAGFTVALTPAALPVWGSATPAVAVQSSLSRDYRLSPSRAPPAA